MTTVSSRSFTSLTATILLAGCLCHAASAADATAPDEQTARQDTVDEAVPLIAIEGSSELQMDAGIGNNGTTSFYATVEPEITVNLSDAFRLFGHFVFEPVLDPIEGQTNVLRSQRFYAEELYAGLTAAQVKVALGKINPVFGAATDDAPGIYLRLRRQLRLQRRTGTGDKILSHRGHHRERRRCPDGEADNRRPVFTADPSVFSRLLFTDRGQFNWQDARVGSTIVDPASALKGVARVLAVFS